MTSERDDFLSQMRILQSESEQMADALRERAKHHEDLSEQLSKKNSELTTKNSEMKYTALLYEKEREKRQVESQLNARLLSMNSDLKHQVEEVQRTQMRRRGA